MKNILEINTFLFQLVSTTIGTTLTGGVYILERPVDSEKEDIVVGTLPLSEEQIAICNINIFVPDKTVGIGGTTNKVPDLSRMGALANTVIQALDQDTELEQYHYRIVNQTIINEPDLDQHFVNIRLEIRLYF